jgi:hypothetical protein
MPNISLRGIDDPTLGRIKASAKRLKISVNRLIVDTLRAQFGAAEKGFDDLDDLAGKWTDAQAREFDAAVAPFGEIESGMWVAEPRAPYKAEARVRASKSAKGKRR